MPHIGWFNHLHRSRLQQILNTARSTTHDRVLQQKQIKSDLQQSRSMSQSSDEVGSALLVVPSMVAKGYSRLEVRIKRIIEDNHGSHSQVIQELLRSHQPDLVSRSSTS